MQNLAYNEESLRIEKLVSPALKGAIVEFIYPFRKYPSKYDQGLEFLDVICNALREFDTVDDYVHELIESPETTDLNNISEVEYLLKIFNHAAINRAKLAVGDVPQPASKELLARICSISYNRAIDNASSLNNYKIGSSFVYGEITIDCFQRILNVIQPTERDIFVDLGSGVGHLVTYISGATRIKKAVGIEKAAVPAGYAVKLSKEFRNWMKWFGKMIRPFELYQGDFLDEKYRRLLTKRATILFINNLAFTPALDEKIKSEIINKLRDGTLVITTKNYGKNDRITDRTVNDVSSILDVSIVGIYNEACSWTEATLTFYLHRVNRSRLQGFFATKNQGPVDGIQLETEETSRSLTGQRMNPKKRKECVLDFNETLQLETPLQVFQIDQHQQQLQKQSGLAPILTEAFIFAKTPQEIIYFPQHKKLKPRPQ